MQITIDTREYNKYCPNCGRLYHKDFNYCPKCENYDKELLKVNFK